MDIAHEDHPPPEHWMLERKIPLALLLAILLQTVAVVWGAATLHARVEQLERQAAATGPQVERLVRVETKMDGMSTSLVELKDMIRQRPIR